jgi:type II secretory pathway component GspD/PulD (secretin)
MTPIVRGDMISVQVEQTEEGEDVRTNPLLLELEANPYPVINRRTVSTTVDVKDGEVFVMGGLVQRQAGDSFISVLGIFDIPLPENLVRLVEKQAQDAEVAIVITPSIVRE